jgi:hypothetical protein
MLVLVVLGSGTLRMMPDGWYRVWVAVVLACGAGTWCWHVVLARGAGACAVLARAWCYTCI